MTIAVTILVVVVRLAPVIQDVIVRSLIPTLVMIAVITGQERTTMNIWRFLVIILVLKVIIQIGALSARKSIITVVGMDGDL